MAGITTAVLGGLSAASSYKASRQAKRQADQANAALARGQIGNYSISGPGGVGGSYNVDNGQISTRLGSRLQGQQNLFDAMAGGFANRDLANIFGDARGTLGQMQGVAGMQPQQGDFSGLQGLIGGNVGLADLGINQAFGQQQGLNQFGNQAFGLAQNFLGELAGGGSEAARANTLDLLRQQAQPFEQRAFSGLQDNQFATGRLGSSGGALQTEAFARGLGQADLSRQLAANQEGRNFQQNALGLAQGSAGMGTQAMGLGDSLLSSAFGRFGSMAGLAADVEGQRFGQQLTGQNNLFNQLGSLFTQQVGLTGSQQSIEQQNLQNVLSLFGAGNQLNQIPLEMLQFAQNAEQMRSNAALGQGNVMSRSGDATAQATGMASIFSGLGQASQGGQIGSFLQSLGGLFGSKPQAPQPGVGGS